MHFGVGKILGKILADVVVHILYQLLIQIHQLECRMQLLVSEKT